MCGLVAVLDERRIQGNVQDTMEAALGLIAHRGLPGRAAFSRLEHSLVGHVRLPIVGLDREFDQPQVEDGCALAFVGEVHNFREIMPGASCDTEVIIPRWREGMLAGWADFDGFWQMALLDGKNGVACFAVDYLAQKPLYFRHDLGVFASELNALKAFGPLELDPVYLSNVRKWGYDPTDRTPYIGVSAVPPGSAVVCSLKEGTSQYSAYYPLKVPEVPTTPGALRSALERSVERRLVSDVPIAILLSGGLDSTIVALLAARLGAKVTAFYVENGEERYAELAARAGDFDLVPLELHESGDHAQRAMQEPVDLGSVSPQWALARALHSEGFRVALSGDGADELFGGYRRAKDYDSQASDITCELVQYHLPRLDRLMMAHTVELRTPFLAPYVIEAALGTPRELRTEKQLLKRAFSDMVPKAILDRDKRPLRSTDPYDPGHRNRIVDEFIRHHRGEPT